MGSNQQEQIRIELNDLPEPRIIGSAREMISERYEEMQRAMDSGEFFIGPDGQVEFAETAVVEP